MDFSGKNVLITGASGGIGLATKRLFAGLGANVIGTDLYFPKPDESKDFTQFIQGDTSKQVEVKNIVEEVIRNFESIHVLINNCGVGANLDHSEGRSIVCQTAIDLDRDDFMRVMDINLLSAVWFVKYIIPHMPKDDGSCIVSASSIWSRGVLHYALPYSISKAALSVAALNWARQFAPIRSIGVVLGGIDTSMLRTNPEGVKEVGEQTLLRRAGTPEEAAETYVYAASCRYLTATEIVLDGGSFNR
jgi:3-oxoacyl-[acyl-carrier protein] reductase